MMIRTEHIRCEELITGAMMRKLSQTERRGAVATVTATITAAVTSLDVFMATHTATPSESVSFVFCQLRAFSPVKAAGFVFFRLKPFLPIFLFTKSFEIKIFPFLGLFSDR